ncbi:hypothetical protein CE91St44_27820 [Oscillospiraceae bacterium]|nr:hypothetical protein CE91St44_27820 [Oscillospiraceae bacterium]
MKKVLEQIYQGELYPYLQFRPTVEHYKKNLDEAFRSYSAFLEKLPDEFQDEFKKLIDSHLDLLPLELEQNFVDGFCIGARIMAEVFFSPLEGEKV